ncbi:DUF3829 domain-containing protein [Paenibacillus albiflavus]|uniref:DUF3829 domain-containing protein n=1 Tax=Paenibacillus albiflavus TaxID=2545760 RepID=A0A4R4EE16_9BACL|nr:YiiG family protein [Paenibacillus albiflavus]TCZ78254.1 DUF3829 domain-containing protein [Paenibacillus albiflavus]
MKKLFQTITLVLLSSIVLVSCSKLKLSPKASVSSSTPSSTPSTSTQPSPEETKLLKKMQEVEKYNAYVGLNNLITGSIDNVTNRYFEQLGMEESPKIGKNFSFTMLSISSTVKSNLDKYLAYTDKKPEFTEIDPIVVKLKPVLKDLIAVLSEGHEYYDIKGYVDDQFAKSKELHTEILKITQAYEPIRNEFLDAMYVLGEEQTQITLKELQDEDQMIRYSALQLILSAEAVDNEMADQDIAADNVLNLNLEKYKAKYDVFVESMNKLNEYAQDEARIKKEGIDSYSLEQFVKKVKELKVSATNIIDRVNKKKKVDDFNLQSSFFRETQEGTPENYGKNLGQTIDYYNKMINK